MTDLQEENLMDKMLRFTEDPQRGDHKIKAVTSLRTLCETRDEKRERRETAVKTCTRTIVLKEVATNTEESISCCGPSEI